MLPALQTALQTPTPVAQVATPSALSEAALGRLPMTAVISPLSIPEVANHLRGGTASRVLTNTAASPASPPVVGDSANRIAGTGANGFSSGFLAQLMAQSGAGDANAAPIIVDYETLVAYSQVKYKPSDAGKPPPPPPPTEVAPPPPPTPQEIVQTAPNVAPPPEVPTPTQTAPDMTVPEQVTQQVAAQAEAAPAPQTLPASKKDTTAPQPATTRFDRTASFNAARGAAAYIAAFVRNYTPVAAGEPQLNVSL